MSRDHLLPALLLGCAVPLARAGDPPGLYELELEQLMNLEVSTAARKDQPLSQTPAAAYVITREEIRRSGATSIPEALRLAPGVAVAQISPSKWSVSIRGFSGRFANKLLVLIDGRTVYTPMFSGTYWEIHDPMLEDVERIEVIRGPGATLWGANAVNGIVNIITRTAQATQGVHLQLAAGDRQHAGGARWGEALDADAHLRLYAKASGEDGFAAADGSGDLDDGYDRQQAGFRADWSPTGVDQMTLQGDLIRMDQDQVLTLPDPTLPPTYATRTADEIEVDAANLLARWERSLAVDAEIRLQAYGDYYRREEITRDERVTTFDLDFQHRFAAARIHDIVWGLGYRHTDDQATSAAGLFGVGVASRAMDTFSGFLQDEIELADNRVWLMLGTKVEHNDLTGVEWQPNVRALWALDARQSLWASVARAVRTPSFGERDYRVNTNVIPPFSAANPGPLPILRAVDGNPDYGSERLVAYELGLRRRLDHGLTLDLALFYNDYDELLVTRLAPPQLVNGSLVLPTPTANDMKGSSYGGELTLDWHPSQAWRVRPTLSLLRSHFRLTGESNLTGKGRAWAVRFREGTDPQVQFSLRTGWSPHSHLDLDLWLRYVSEVPELGGSSGLDLGGVDDYLTLDLRAAWRPYPDLELAIVGKNLLAPRHLEGIEDIYPVPAHVPRSVLATLTYRF
jgi:iron complex outermembrane receptor protein